MLPRQFRLPLKTELVRIKKEGRLFQGRLFSLLVSQQTTEVGDQPSRFGFIISTKVHKKAVKRNRARRLLAEAIQGLLPQIRAHFDVVFLAKKTLIGQELGVVKKEVTQVFRQAGLTN